MPLFAISALVGCDRVLPRLQQAMPLTVHSVFHRACNLQTPDGSLLALQIAGMPLSPAALILDCDDLSTLLQPGERLYATGNHIQGARWHISLAQTEWQSTRQPTDCRPQSELAPILTHFLPANPPPHGFWQQLQHTDRHYLSPKLAALADWIATPAGAPDPLLRPLIGFGHGLTPAGDDFLLGLLFTLEWQRHPCRPALAAAILRQLPRTTVVSAAMLAWGCAGHYGANLLALLVSPPSALPDAVAAVAAYGHSSGHDMLCGIHFGLSLHRGL